MEFDLQKIRKYARLELLAKQQVEGFITGLHKSPYHGFSVEFAEHRIYNQGESTKYIDWKVFAKTEKLYTKTFEEETNLRCMMLIDNSASMYYPAPTYDKMGFSIVAAASLAFLLQKQRDAVGLSIFNDSIETQTQIKSSGRHLHQILNTLQSLALQSPKENFRKTSVAKAIHQIAQQVHKRSLIIIFSDMLEGEEEKMEEVFEAIQHLKYKKHEVLIFHVTDHSTEWNFDFEDKPYKFTDAETGEEIKLNPYQIREAYRKKASEKFHDIKLKCGQYKIDFVQVDTAQSIDTILQSYINKRAKMRV